MLSRTSWLYVGVAILVAAVIAARIWAQEIREFETRTLDALGIPFPVRVVGAVALLGLVGYRYYARSKREAVKLGQPVIRRSVAIFALGSLVLVVVLVFFASRV